MQGEVLNNNFFSKSTPNKFLLFLFLFFLVFGPRLFGSFLLDFISLTSLLILYISFIFPGYRVFWSRSSIIPIFFFCIMISYSFFVTITSGNLELFYPFKFFRALLNYLAAYVLAFWYVCRYRNKFPEILMRHLFLVIVVHAFIMVFQYLNPEFGKIIYKISGYSRMKFSRVTGLTISYNTLNIVQGFGLFLGIYFSRYSLSVKERIFYIISSFIILFAMLLAGRSALFVFIGGIIIYLLFDYRKYIATLKFIIGILFCLCFFITFLNKFYPQVIDRFFYVTLFFLLPTFLQSQLYGITKVNYAETLFQKLTHEMILIPKDLKTLLLGCGISGRGDIYITSDIGYILFIWGIGLLGTFMVLLFYFYLIAYGIKWKKFNFFYSFVTIFFNFAILVLHMKEQELLTRHSFTISSLLLCSFYIYNSYYRGLCTDFAERFKK